MDYAKTYYQNHIEKQEYNEYLTVDETKQALVQFRNTILFQIPTNADSRIREIYTVLLSQTDAVDPIGWLAEPEVFISTVAAKNGKKQFPWCGLAGIVILAAMIVRFAVTKKIPDVITAVIIGVGLIALFVQCIVLWISSSAKPQQNIVTRQRVSSARFKMAMQQLAKTLDSHADTLYQQQKTSEIVSSAGNTGNADIDLLTGLLKLPDVARNGQAMNVIDMYLVRHGITMLEYSEENAHLFAVMPADITATITPVLIKDGKTLNQGIACKKSEVQ